MSKQVPSRVIISILLVLGTFSAILCGLAYTGIYPFPERLVGVYVLFLITSALLLGTGLVGILQRYLHNSDVSSQLSINVDDSPPPYSK